MLNKQSHTEKHLRALQRELTRLQQRLRNPPVHPLISPIQRGWKRHFVMTPTARVRPDAAILEAILAVLNTVQYFWRADFNHTRRQRSLRRGLISIDQELRAIRSCEWEKELVPLPWRKYFRRELLPVERLLAIWPHWTDASYPYPRFVRPGHRGYEWGYAFRFTSLFDLKVEKHWLTHYSEIEPDVIERIAEIERWMEHHHGHAHFNHLKGRSWRRWRGLDERQKCRTREARREMYACLGFLVGEAAEHIPSIIPCGGHGGWDVFSRLVGDGCNIQFFAAVRSGLLRSLWESSQQRIGRE